MRSGDAHRDPLGDGVQRSHRAGESVRIREPTSIELLAQDASVTAFLPWLMEDVLHLDRRSTHPLVGIQPASVASAVDVRLQELLDQSKVADRHCRLPYGPNVIAVA